MLDELELQQDSGSAATAILELEQEVELNKERELPQKPQLRFYSVGPSTYRVLCPLCQQRARTETVQMAGAFGQLSCLLSVFSWWVWISNIQLSIQLTHSLNISLQLFSHLCAELCLLVPAEPAEEQARLLQQLRRTSGLPLATHLIATT